MLLASYGHIYYECNLSRVSVCGGRNVYLFWGGHNFGSRYARKPTNDTKDLDDSLISKTTLSQKSGSLDWRPGSGKIGQKTQNTPTCDVTPIEPKTKKIVFQPQPEDFLNP